MPDKKKIEITDAEETMPSTEQAAAEAAAAGVAEQAPAPDAAGQVAALEAALAEAREAHLRAVADLQNFRRRSAEERAQQLQFANEALVSELLPIVDNFTRATVCEVDTEAARNLLRGVCMIQQQLQEVLTRFGVQRLETAGAFFDPALHEAVERVETSEVCEGTVVGELEAGYTLNGRIVRPARVQVAVAPH